MCKKFIFIFTLFELFLLIYFNVQSRSIINCRNDKSIVICFNDQEFSIKTINDSVEQKVDSLFSLRFNQMNKVLSYNETQHDGNIDRCFVYLLTFLSGVDCKTSDYSGFCYFSYDEYNQWLAWYQENGYKIKWEMVQKAYAILNKKNIKTKEDIEFLNKLKIE